MARLEPSFEPQVESRSQERQALVQRLELGGMLQQRGSRDLAVPPDAEGNPVLVHLHEHDGPTLAPLSVEVLEDGEPGGVVTPRQGVGVRSPAAEELVVCKGERIRLQIERFEPLKHPGRRCNEDLHVVPELRMPEHAVLADLRVMLHALDEPLAKDVVYGGGGPPPGDELPAPRSAEESEAAHAGGWGPPC